MNLSLLRTDPLQFLLNLCYYLPCILISLSVHEAAHSFAALKMGDESQRYRGRITINPLRHIEPVGFLALLVTGFGWAKPVQVNPYNFRDSKKGMAITAIAGPIANFILMTLAVILCGLCDLAVYKLEEGAAALVFGVLSTFFYYLALLNAGLGLFNLIPIPPLDGSRVLGLFLSDRAYFKLMEYERYGFLVLIAL
ncbi:MAG: site-2 protease family protein, partial [Clostridia bacterium]|nr:site-2 protease family protein [Clostridia bacterium]